jgi:hypothetical protein
MKRLMEPLPLHTHYVSCPSRIPSEPVYELKMAFSHHAWLCAEHTAAWRARVAELREPPLGLEKVPHESLGLALNEAFSAASTAELLLCVYEVLLPALHAALMAHLRDAHPLADQPTRRLCRLTLVDVDDMLDYGRRAIDALVQAADRVAATPVLDAIRGALATAGGLDGTTPSSAPAPAPIRSAQPRRFDPVPKRDARFPDPHNLGVNAEVFLYDERMPDDAKVLMMYYKRLREIDVPEMMASILMEAEGRPWAYHRDLTRQLWDEARHAMMGEVGFVAAGVDWSREVRVNFNWSLALNTQLTARERHAVLYFIEQGLMPRTGKRHEWEVSLRANNPLAATFQDFDWADEVLHARIGRDWYVNDMPSAHEAVAYGDQCWNKVFLDWETCRRQGLTEHHNWWPDLYRAWAERQGQTPDPRALAFNVTYAAVRPDLKDVSGPA